MVLTLGIRVVIGALVGILINYLADVLPVTRRFSKPICRKCQTPFSVKGYLFSFTCSHCAAKPKKRDFLVTFFSIVFSLLVSFFPFGEINYWLTIPIMLFLGVIIVIDIEYHAVLIETSILGLLLFAIYGFFYQGFLITLVGGLAGFATMLLIYFFGMFFNKLVGKIRHQDIQEVALGFGDIYVGSFLGFLTGWPTVMGTIIMAILASGVFSLLYIFVQIFRKKYQSLTAIPYAPFLILGAIATFYIR